MDCELLATCNGLGFLEEGRIYKKEPDCLETIKDLIKFLRREDDTKEIRRQLGQAQILQSDLLHIVKQYSNDETLFEATIRLMVNITTPAEVCFGKIPEDKTFHQYYLDIISHLQQYKEAYTDDEFMSILASKLKSLLDREWEDRRDEHTLLMERILLLIRNILHVPANPEQEMRTDDDASVHDQVLWAFNISGMDKLILYIASSDDEQQWCMHAVEIVSLMFREQTPEQLAKAGVAKSLTERQNDQRELETIRQRELAKQREVVMKRSSRHSRFGGSFSVKNMKSISDRDLVYHHSVNQAKQINFDLDKKPAKKAKNRMPMKEKSVSRRSTLSIRLFLKDFCVLFLENCYNPLMHNVKDHILHDRAQQNDETYYLWVMHFFMEFNRIYKFRVDIVSETFSVQAFHFIETQITKYLDMMMTEKKEVVSWSRRLHMCLRCYKELLLTLDTMGQSKDESLRDTAHVIISNVVYVIEYREVFISLLKKFDETKFTEVYLKDLVETTHVFLKMLESFCKNKNKVIVQKKARKKRKKKKKVNVQNSQPEEDLDALWSGVSSTLSAMVEGSEEVPDDITPFDATSDRPVEEQRSDAVVRIQQCLKSGKAGEALGLLRAAREVWSDGDVFGAVDIEPQEELMALREILTTNLNVDNTVQDRSINEEEDDDDDEEDEEDELMTANYAEETFNLKQYLNRFAHYKIIQAYVHLLKFFRKNSTHTNHCILKLLHRVAFDLHMEPLLFQLSLFRVFQKLLNDSMAKLPEYKEMVTFAKYIMRKFFEKLETNKKLYVEILFWKDVKEAYELSEGYGSLASDNANRQKTSFWAEEEEEELRMLYDQYKDKEDEDIELDVVDHIMKDIINQGRTRRQIIAQLIRMDIISSTKDIKKKRVEKRPGVWLEEHEYELRNLFDQFKGSNDVVGSILENMTVKRSKNKVIEKIMSMELVNDKKELYKKREKKAGNEGRRRRRKKGSDEDDEDDDIVDNTKTLEFQQGLPSDFEEPEASATSDSGSESDGEVKTTESMLMNAQREGLTNQVRWIQDLLRTTANDLDEEDEDDDDEEDVPIVTFSEEHNTAISNRTFQKFLKQLGVKAPSNHQEQFWRIPGHLTSADLRRLADEIEPKDDITEVDKKAQSRKDMLKEMSKAKRKENKAAKRAERERKREEQRKKFFKEKGGDVVKENGVSKKRKKQKNKIIRTADSSSSDSDDKLSNLRSKPSKKQPNVNNLGDSDEDDVPINSTSVPVERASKKRMLSESSSSDDGQAIRSHSKQAKKSRLMSDSEEEEKVTTKSGSKKQNRTLISSDEEDMVVDEQPKTVGLGDDEEDSVNVKSSSKRLKKSLVSSDEENMVVDEKSDQVDGKTDSLKQDKEKRMSNDEGNSNEPKRAHKFRMISDSEVEEDTVNDSHSKDEDDVEIKKNTSDQSMKLRYSDSEEEMTSHDRNQMDKEETVGRTSRRQKSWLLDSDSEDDESEQLDKARTVEEENSKTNTSDVNEGSSSDSDDNIPIKKRFNKIDDSDSD
ncbi:protein timeless homolog [Antedon mediterranea]|uniref:protein timeless homolog n=1 Tax=Antedon mediterranea TaxID=105859 RepID=UPI003AF92A79